MTPTKNLVAGKPWTGVERVATIHTGDLPAAHSTFAVDPLRRSLSPGIYCGRAAVDGIVALVARVVVVR